MAKTGEHAVVLGASIAGMLAARVLADHFDTVTVVERDVLGDAPETRQECHRDAICTDFCYVGHRPFDELFPGSSTSSSQTAPRASTAAICPGSTSV